MAAAAAAAAATSDGTTEEEEPPTTFERDFGGGGEGGDNMAAVPPPPATTSEDDDDDDDDEAPKDYTVRKVFLPKCCDAPPPPPPPSSDGKLRSMLLPRPEEAAAASSSSSVLRTLLQASGRQLMLYRHRSEQPLHLTGGGGGGRHHHHQQQRPSPSDDEESSGGLSKPPPSRRRGNFRPHVVRHSVGCQTFPAGVHLPLPAAMAGCPEVERPHNSQIKALLLGQDYVREDNHAVVLTSAAAPRRSRSPGEDEEEEDEEEQGQSPEAKRRKTYENVPPLLTAAAKIVEEFGDLTFSVQHGHQTQFLEVRRKGLYGIPSVGMVPAQVVVDEEGTCQFLSVLGPLEEVRCKTRSGELVLDELRPLLHKLSIKGGHVFCPGVEAALVELAPATKNLTFVGLPQRQYQSKDCLVWYRLAPNQSWLPLNDGVHKCKTCRNLERHLRTFKKSSKERRDNENVLGVSSGDFLCVWGTTTDDDVET